ncbi:hypothetical protein TNIN_18921 [Trichonephila inaurata madagascariensis]|uniref:Uncharacterized protein n=1 Tax=Trichonephila inaurata madagascariensis TaxID=2747483 RepID=A0A8X7CHJ4_9ARAC|nr:hypothetical protein TNIN_18921 [Trichonephila inaurata madagascariensis]
MQSGVVSIIILAMTSRQPQGDFLGEEKVGNYSLWDEPGSFVSTVTYSLSFCSVPPPISYIPLLAGGGGEREHKEKQKGEQWSFSDVAFSSGL